MRESVEEGGRIDDKTKKPLGEGSPSGSKPFDDRLIATTGSTLGGAVGCGVWRSRRLWPTPSFA